MMRTVLPPHYFFSKKKNVAQHLKRHYALTVRKDGALTYTCNLLKCAATLPLKRIRCSKFLYNNIYVFLALEADFMTVGSKGQLDSPTFDGNGGVLAHAY